MRSGRASVAAIWAVTIAGSWGAGSLGAGSPGAGAQTVSGAQTVAGLWLAKGFEEAKVRRLEGRERAGATVGAKDGEADLLLSLSLIRLKGSSWTEARVLRQVERTERILGACGIGLGEVEVVAVQTPGRAHDLTMAADAALPVPRDVLDLAARVPEQAPRPRVFFVGRLLGDDALARSYWRDEGSVEEAKRHPYIGTAWVAFKTHWMERGDAGYSTLAHELAHLLCECGHEGGERRHLLHRYRNFLSGEILPQHCAAMRASPLLRPARPADPKGL